jgi:predicted aspartyl protease
MRRAWKAALAVLALMAPGRAFAVDPWPGECKLTLAAGLPMTQTSSLRITVPVDVNDRHRNFAIDTGGFASAIDPGIVAEQNLPLFGIHGNVSLRDVGGKKAAQYARIDRLTLDHLRAQDARLMVLDAQGDTDGILAPDYLRNFDVELDMADKQVNLFRPHPCSDRAVYWTGDYAVLPMDVTTQGHIRIDVTLNGQTLRAMIDTGSERTLIGADTAKSLFGIDAVFSEGKIRGGSGGTVRAVAEKFATLTIGGNTISDPLLEVTSQEAWARDGARILLGMDMLQRFHMLIAYRERKFYLSPDETKP